MPLLNISSFCIVLVFAVLTFSLPCSIQFQFSRAIPLMLLQPIPFSLPQAASDDLSALLTLLGWATTALLSSLYAPFPLKMKPLLSL